MAVRLLATSLLTSLSVGAFLVSCNLAEGLSDVGSSLGSPDAGLIDAPGRKLAAGRFRSLLIDGSFDDGGNVLAMQDLDAGSQAVVIPYPEGEPCQIAPAVNFERLSSRISVELPGIFSVQKNADEDGRGEIFFSDFRCNEVFPVMQKAFPPRATFPALMPRGVLAINSDGDLQLLEPAKSAPTPISEGVSSASATGSYLWTIEKGQLYVRDGDLKLVAQVGKNVSSYVPSAGMRITAAFVDEDGLSVWSEKDGVTLLSDSACAPHMVGNDTLAYLDPCQERKLRIYTLGDRLGSDDEFVTLDGPTSVIAHERLLSQWGSGTKASELIFLLGTEGAQVGELALVSLPADTAAKDGHIQLTYSILSSDRAAIAGQELFVEYDGSTGTLVELERDDEKNVTGLRRLAERVAQLPGGSGFSFRGILHDFKDGVGHLGILHKDKATGEVSITDIASGVPPQDQSVESGTGRFAFIGNHEGDNIGTLYLTPELDGAPHNAQVIASHVFRNTARFLEQPHGLAYLYKEPGTERAQLRVYLIDSELTVMIHPQVAEYRTVPWPSPGILYAVPEGEDQGLWYAKAR